MCQKIKAGHQRSVGLLHPWEVEEWKWEHVTMDFVTHLSWTSRGHDMVWVIMDRLNKSAHFLADNKSSLFWVFFFSNTSYQFLMTTDFLLPKTGQLQGFYNKNDVSSLRSERVFSFLDYISC